MRDVIEKTWGWDEAWQRNDFETRFKECLVSIIEADGRDVGSLWLRSRPELLYIVDLCGDMGSVLNPCIIWKPRAMPALLLGGTDGFSLAGWQDEERTGVAAFTCQTDARRFVTCAGLASLVGAFGAALGK